jgi:hypothetical protein
MRIKKSTKCLIFTSYCCKKFYSKVIIVNHISSKLLPHYFVTLLHKSIYYFEHKKSYVHKKNSTPYSFWSTHKYTTSTHMQTKELI